MMAAFRMYEGQNKVDKDHVRVSVVIPVKWHKTINKIAKSNIRGIHARSGHIRQAIKYYIMELKGIRVRS